MQRADLIDLAIRSSYYASQELVPIVDQKLIVDLEERLGLVPAGNGLNGLSPTDIPLADNKREKFGVNLTSVCSLRTLASQM